MKSKTANMNIENFRAVKIKNGRTLIVLKENFDALLTACKATREAEEVTVTEEMLKNAEYLLPPAIPSIPKVPEFDYEKQLHFQKTNK